ncbi:MAG: hypothetical protein ACO27G_06180, partial [Bacteroidia bacterium]
KGLKILVSTVRFRPIPQKAEAPSLKTRGLLSFLGHSNVVLVVCEGGFGENLSHRGGVFD